MSTTHNENQQPPNAAIISPVSRHLVVTDIDRSIAFYCDVLGFSKATDNNNTNAAVALEYGPARLALSLPVSEADNNVPMSPPEHAMVFFEVADVHVMQEAILARGGHPTQPVKVNWMKMELFEVRDPDGHILWFGKSFHEFYTNLHTEAGKGQLRTIMPAMPLSNIPAGITWYRDVLGFSINYQQHDLGVMDRDSIRLLLIARSAQHTGIGSCAFYIRDADALYAELVSKGASITAPPRSQPWGLREFHVQDPEGNTLTFAQTFE
jgi:predicted enzyme related to lactoylglutathione lyase